MSPPPEITVNDEFVTDAVQPKNRRHSMHRITHHPHPDDAVSILHNPHFNKGTAFTVEERKRFHLDGLLPPTVETLNQQVKRALAQFRHFTVPLSKHIYLCSLRERNETLFYRLVCENLVEMMPIIYTPTVGEGCLQFGWQYRQAEGMYFCKRDRGHIRKMLNNWKINARDEVAFIVVTDGSRILGLGDLGANGMGIPIGKSSLYVAAGGFHPAAALPVVLDCGTNNTSILCDDFYLGVHEQRLADSEFYPLVEEFMLAVREKWPRCLVQFEDFSNNHCFDLLEIWRHKSLCFNDDIQGTGCVVAAGFLSAMRMRGVPDWKEAKIMVLGSGSAAVGVAVQICNALMFKYGIDKDTAYGMFHMMDSKGLVTTTRGDTLPDFKQIFAKDYSTQYKSFKEALFEFKPFALVGLSTIARAFDEEVIRFMAKEHERPIIMPLSNPTSKSECSAAEAFQWTNGKVLFASGSPFPPVKVGNKAFTPSQGNNLYTFPGIGFGSWISGAKSITDNMLTASTIELSECVTQDQIDMSELYPSLEDIRDVSARIATAVFKQAVADGVATEPVPDNILEFIKKSMYFPSYLSC